MVDKSVLDYFFAALDYRRPSDRKVAKAVGVLIQHFGRKRTPGSFWEWTQKDCRDMTGQEAGDWRVRIEKIRPPDQS